MGRQVLALGHQWGPPGTLPHPPQAEHWGLWLSRWPGWTQVHRCMCRCTYGVGGRGCPESTRPVVQRWRAGASFTGDPPGEASPPERWPRRGACCPLAFPWGLAWQPSSWPGRGPSTWGSLSVPGALGVPALGSGASEGPRRGAGAGLPRLTWLQPLPRDRFWPRWIKLTIY